MRLSLWLALVILPTVAQAAAPKHIGKPAADKLVLGAIQAKFPKARVTFYTGGHSLETPKMVSNHLYIVHTVEDGKHFQGHVAIDMRAKSPREGSARVKKIHLVADPDRDRDMALLGRIAGELRGKKGSEDLLKMVEAQLSK